MLAQSFAQSYSPLHLHTLIHIKHKVTPSTYKPMVQPQLYPMIKDTTILKIWIFKSTLFCFNYAYWIFPIKHNQINWIQITISLYIYHESAKPTLTHFVSSLCAVAEIENGVEDPLCLLYYLNDVCKVVGLCAHVILFSCDHKPQNNQIMGSSFEPTCNISFFLHCCISDPKYLLQFSWMDVFLSTVLLTIASFFIVFFPSFLLYCFILVQTQICWRLFF